MQDRFYFFYDIVYKNNFFMIYSEFAGGNSIGRFVNSILESEGSFLFSGLFQCCDKSGN